MSDRSNNPEAILRARFEQMGIKVTPDEQIVNDTEELGVACRPCSSGPTEILGAKVARCNKCDAEVWLSPSSRTIIEAREKVGNLSKIWCITCMIAASKN